MYIEVGQDNSNTARMALAFDGDSTTRKWEIKVAQVSLDLQYGNYLGYRGVENLSRTPLVFCYEVIY